MKSSIPWIYSAVIIAVAGAISCGGSPTEREFAEYVAVLNGTVTLATGAEVEGAQVTLQLFGMCKDIPTSAETTRTDQRGAYRLVLKQQIAGDFFACGHATASVLVGGSLLHTSRAVTDTIRYFRNEAAAVPLTENFVLDEEGR